MQLTSLCGLIIGAVMAHCTAISGGRMARAFLHRWTAGPRRTMADQGGPGRTRPDQGGPGRTRSDQAGPRRTGEDQGGSQRVALEAVQGHVPSPRDRNDHRPSVGLHVHANIGDMSTHAARNLMV